MNKTTNVLLYVTNSIYCLRVGLDFHYGVLVGLVGTNVLYFTLLNFKSSNKQIYCINLIYTINLILSIITFAIHMFLKHENFIH